MDTIYLVVPGNEFGSELSSGEVFTNEGEALLKFIEKSEDYDSGYMVITLYKIENMKIELLKVKNFEDE
jgi:DNA polymerase elongation subunit (family B)